MPTPEGVDTPAYHDRRITCTDTGVQVRGYFFPWGTKRFDYSAVRAWRQVEMSAFGGRGRIWGTGNFKYWANLDPQRPKKDTAFLIDLGRGMQPFLTPDDPAAFGAVLRRGTGKDPVPEDGGRGPSL
jgi:hypothetical protein